MAGNSILIIDDDNDVLDALHALLEDEFAAITTEGSPTRIPALLQHDYDVILLDMNFSAGINSGNEGLFWLNEILVRKPTAAVVMMTAYGNINLAVEAIKRGAKDFVLKPWDNEKLISTLLACMKKRKVATPLTAGASPFVEGKSPAMVTLQEQIRKVAATDASVLILGENGTGKELVARELHRLSARSQRPFISADLSTLSSGIFESELFGHVKGAFTDARTDRTGLFQTANGGTLFLDEIGNLSQAHQAKLLTVLQNRTITPVGSNLTIGIDVRLISATNAPIMEQVTNGAFRQDLLYRINTITLTVPPLRERREDIVNLASYFLQQYGNKYGRANLAFTPEAVQALLDHTWPGNVRELQHTMEKIVILSSHDAIGVEDLNLSTSSRPITVSTKTLDEIEKEALTIALNAHGGNILQAARALGITRQTLYNKMKRYGL